MTQVLDLGEVRLLGFMGGDASVVGSARVSTAKDPEVASKGAESDAKLINFLMKHGHGTPFEHSVFQWYVKAPLFVVREWQRHRVASYNEQSGRYAEFEPEFYVPDHVRMQDPANKQSSVRVDGRRAELRYAIGQIKQSNKHDFAHYQTLLARGVAREMARMVLPLNLYSSFWWTINARSLLNFLMLRNSEAAQWEIRQFAIAIEEIFAERMPVTHAAFLDRGRVAP